LVHAKGRTAQHTFDSVTKSGELTIAINVLLPGSGALGRAQRYGYQSLDPEGRPEQEWKKMAILARPETWSAEAKRLVSDFAAKIVDFSNPKMAREPIRKSLEELSGDAA
jgi:hypothetical protein